MLEDTAQVLNSGADVRGATLDEFKALGADIVKLRVEWENIAPNPGARPKPSFDATDPAAYPAGAWNRARRRRARRRRRAACACS